MKLQELNIDLPIEPELPKNKDFKIGVIGSGFIVNDCHLPAYKSGGLNVYGIASRTYKNANKVAKTHDIPNVYPSWQALIQDEHIEILDIAIPPDKQLEVVKEAVKQKHIKGILCQKPLAMNFQEAQQMVSLCKDAGIKLGVNSNMRYDQSMRSIKKLIDENVLGEIVLATIEMRAIPHWQDFLKQYDTIEILNMGIHHIDIFRYLFGNPAYITALARKDPRTTFDHIDGISQYTFQYENNLMASSLDDVWAWSGKGTEEDMYIKWRIEGIEGMAQGTFGWPEFPTRKPSTLELTTKKVPNKWIKPNWESVWFPDAFLGTMSQLLRAVEDNTEPEISGTDNLYTMAAIDACYESIEERKTVDFQKKIKKINGGN